MASSRLLVCGQGRKSEKVTPFRSSPLTWGLEQAIPNHVALSLEKTLVAFHSIKHFRNFRNGDKWYGNFQGKIPENSEIVEFPKKERDIEAKIPESTG